MQANTTLVTYYEMVTNRVVQHLKKGMIPWNKSVGPIFAQSYTSGHVYTGINWFLLNCLETHLSPYFLTQEQVQSMNLTLKQDDKPSYVYYYKKYYADPVEGFVEADQIGPDTDLEPAYFLRPRKVYNIKGIAGITEGALHLSPQEHCSVEACHALVERLPDVPLIISEDPMRSFYDAALDAINLSAEEYYDSELHLLHTLLQNVVHWTGAESRLNRKVWREQEGKHHPDYNEERLIAELAMCYLRGCTGLQYNAQTSSMQTLSYLHSMQDHKFIFRACAEAQKAVNYILGIG